jgi:hypothetical protein
MVKARGRYHLLCAESYEGRYSCMASSAKSIYGPYGPRYEAIPHGGHNALFRAGAGRWWSTFFGPPWYERPAILPVEFGRDGVLGPSAQPDRSQG